MRHPSLYWHRQKDLNPRLSVLETDALPTELYLHITVDTRGLEPHSQDFQSCAYTMSAKCPLKRKQKDSNFRSLFEARPLSRGLVSTAHPCFLLFDTAKLDRADAAYLRTKKIFENIFSCHKFGIGLSPKRRFYGVYVETQPRLGSRRSALIGYSTLPLFFLTSRLSRRWQHDCHGLISWR